jgi:hypothetical protein
MQRRHTSARLRFFMPAAGLSVLMLMASAVWPVMAAEKGKDKKYTGFFIALDYALTQPNSLDQHFATHVDASTNPVLDERLVIDNDADSTFRASIGYRLGRGLGSLQVSYWSFENDDLEEGVLNGGVYPTIVGYTYGGGMYIYNASGVRFEATSKVKAETMDLDYTRTTPMSSTFSLKWIAGLRKATYEETQTFLGNDGVNDFLQDKTYNSDAVGLRVGVAGVFGITKHFGLEGSMAMSFLQANTDGVATATFPSGSIQTIRGKDDHVWGDIQDYDLRAYWNFGLIDYYVGYSDSIWSGLPSDPVPAGGCCSGSLAPGGRYRQTISFNSLHAGIVLRFGGRR